jgi:A/G-specific adenine glycosylase
MTGEVRHVFTHFELRLRLVSAQLRKATPDIVWVPVDRLDDYALPTVMRKVVALGFKSAQPKA